MVCIICLTYICQVIKEQLTLIVMYTYKYKGQEIKVIKTYNETGSGSSWYFKVNDSDAHDIYLYKRTAIEAAKDVIDNPELYGITLK